MVNRVPREVPRPKPEEYTPMAITNIDSVKTNIIVRDVKRMSQETVNIRR